MKQAGWRARRDSRKTSHVDIVEEASVRMTNVGVWDIARVALAAASALEPRCCVCHVARAGKTCLPIPHVATRSIRLVCLRCCAALMTKESSCKRRSFESANCVLSAKDIVCALAAPARPSAESTADR